MAEHRRDKFEHEELLTVPLTLGEERQLQLLSPPGKRLIEQASHVLAVLAEKGGGSTSAQSTEETTTCPDSDEEAADTSPAQALVLSHSSPPRLNPFVSLYRSDFDRLCSRLDAMSDIAAADLTGATVAAIAKEFRDAVLRTDREADPVSAAETTSLPSSGELQQALRVLGVPGEHSIGQESADLDAVPVSRGCLVKSLGQMHDADRLAVATRLLDEAWGDSGDSLPVADAAKRLRKAAADRAATAESEGGSGVSCSPCACCKGLKNVLVHCVTCRCCKPKEPLSEPLLRKRLCRPPRHDVSSCAVCINTLPVKAALPLVRAETTNLLDLQDVGPSASAALAPGAPGARDIALVVSGRDSHAKGHLASERSTAAAAVNVVPIDVGTV